MKKTLVLGLALLVALSLSAFAQSDSAQDKASQSQSQDMDRHHHEGKMDHHGAMDSNEMIEHLDQELKLSADQKAQIKTIIDKQHQQMQAEKSSGASGADDRQAQMKQMDETHAQIRAVLTPEQQTKFDTMMKNHRGGMDKHHGDKDHDMDDKPSSQTPK